MINTEAALRFLENGNRYIQHMDTSILLFFFLMLIHVQLFGTRWTVAHQAPLSIGFQARMLEWAARPTLEDPPSPGTEPASPASPASAGGFLTTTLPGKPRHICEYAKETCAYAHT